MRGLGIGAGPVPRQGGWVRLPAAWGVRRQAGDTGVCIGDDDNAAGGRPRPQRSAPKLLDEALGRPALIAVAHGSRDPRSAATMSALVADIAAARPEYDVRLAFLDLNAPSVEHVVAAVAAAGHTHAVVTPLLLGSAFHARVDLPGLLTAARTRHPQLRLTQADVLGRDTRLIDALRDRVVESHATSPSRLGIAVAAVGSSSTAANALTAGVALRLAARTGYLTEVCFATTEPTVGQAISRLRERGADEILVAPWFLAPGLLTDRLLAAAPEVRHADVIGAHPALPAIVWERYDAALAGTLTLSA